MMNTHKTIILILSNFIYLSMISQVDYNVNPNKIIDLYENIDFEKFKVASGFPEESDYYFYALYLNSDDEYFNIEYHKYIHTNNPSSYFLLGLKSIIDSKTDSALFFLDKSIKNNQMLVWAKIELFIINSSSKTDTENLSLISTICNEFEGYSTPKIIKADFLVKLDQLDSAIPTLNKIKRYCLKTEVFNILGDAYNIKGMREKAIGNYNKSIEIKDNFTANLGLGDIYLTEYDSYLKASEYYTRCLSFNFENMSYCYQRIGYLKAVQSKYLEAQSNFEKAISLDSNNIHFFIDYIWLFFVQDRYIEGKKLLDDFQERFGESNYNYHKYLLVYAMNFEKDVYRSKLIYNFILISFDEGEDKKNLQSEFEVWGIDVSNW